MLEQQDRHNTWGHNEVVLDPASVTAALPESIAAIFYMAASSEGQKERARAIHRTFGTDYPCVAAPPLVVLDPGAIQSEPFTLAPGQPSADGDEHGGAAACVPGCHCPPGAPPGPPPPTRPPGVVSFHSVYYNSVLGRAPPMAATKPHSWWQDLSHSAAALNERFRKGRPSDSLLEAGLLLHQFDGQEMGGQGHPTRPWEMCLTNCRTLGRAIHGRASAMVMWAGLRERPDRVAIPLPFGDRGGLLLNPAVAQLDCLYGIDGATYLLNSAEKPGCSESYCDPLQPQVNGQMCGFTGAPATAWRPSDLKSLLTMYAQYGAPYHSPGWHSGYNELVINSKHHNAHLPQAVEAFVFLKGQRHATVDLGYAPALTRTREPRTAHAAPARSVHHVQHRARCTARGASDGGRYGFVISVDDAHQAFLREYGLTSSEAPLLQFDPWNWHEPFSEVLSCPDVPPDTAHTCSQQASYGKCTEDWMAGHCCESCFNCQRGCGRAGVAHG